MEKRKLKIAFFHLGFFYSGGGERLVMEQVKLLRKKGHQVEIWTPFVDEARSFPGEIEKADVKQIFFDLPDWLPSRVFLQLLLTCVLFPLALPKFRKFDVVMAANHPSPWFGYLIKIFLGKPYVVYLVQPTRLIYPRKIDKQCGVRIAGDRVFSPWMVKLLKPIIAVIDKLSVENCDRLLVISEYTKERLKKYYRKAGQVGYPGVKAQPRSKIVVDRFTGAVTMVNKPQGFGSRTPGVEVGEDRTPGVDGDWLPGINPRGCQGISKGEKGWQPRGLNISKPFLLVTNRHFPQKRFDYAIRCLKKLRSEGTNLRLVITGKPTEYTRKLEKMVEELKLDEKPRGLKETSSQKGMSKTPGVDGEKLLGVNRVIFTGFVDEKDLAKLYQNAAVYLYTSPDEDFGLGILEAMAAGTPVVAWDFGGPREMVVDGKTGFLAKPESLEDFTEKVEKLVKEPKLARKMGQAGRQRAREKYSWERHGQVLEQAIYKATNQES